MTSQEKERLAVLETQMAAIIRELSDLRTDLKPIRDAFQQRKGAMWILFVLGSIVGAGIAAGTQIIQFFNPPPGH